MKNDVFAGWHDEIECVGIRFQYELDTNLMGNRIKIVLKSYPNRIQNRIQILLKSY